VNQDSISDIVRNISLHCRGQNGSRTHSTPSSPPRETNRDLTYLPRGKAVPEWRQILVEVKNKWYHGPQSNHPIRLQGVQLHKKKRDSCITVDPIRLQHIPTVHKNRNERQSYSLTKWSNISVDKKNQLDVTFCILYFSSNSCSTCFGQPCAHHQELKTAWCYSLVLVCAVAAGRLSRPVGR